MMIRTRQSLWDILWLGGAVASAFWLTLPSRAQTPRSAQTGWTLEAFLEKVGESNALVKAARLEKEAAALKRRSGDLMELAPFLQGELSYVDDRRETVLPAQQGNRTQVGLYSVGFAKKFVTGTQVSAKWGQTRSALEGLAFPMPSSWESSFLASVSQPLWKDGFGRGVRLRHSREDAQEKVARLSAEMAERRALIAAEEVFWDFAVHSLDRQEKQDSLARAQRIRDWTSRRIGNGIGDRADLLQIESLVASRRLAQIGTEDNLEASRRAFLDALGLPSDETVSISAATLAEPRALPADKEARRLDIWLQQYASEINKNVALETEDRLRPDLSLVGAVGLNGRDAAIGASTSETLGANHPMFQVGLKLSMNLDFSLSENARAAARAEAEAARLRMEKGNRDAASSWSELARRHAELTARVRAMEALVKTQESRLAREQERLSLGRTVTAQVVTFEQEVADTRFGLLQLRAQQRKLEAATRLYMTQEAVEAL